MINVQSKIRKNINVIGYLILCAALLGSLAALQSSREAARKNVQEAIIISCKRTNELSDQRAEEIYNNYRNLARNAKLLGIVLTPQIQRAARLTANRQLNRLRHYDCTILPPHEPVIKPYKLIKRNQGVPKIIYSG